MKNDNIKEIIKNLRERYGSESVHMGFDDIVKGIEVIPTISESLNLALGIGGVPLSRITEIFGTESGSKTTLALSLIATAQKKGMGTVMVDVEHALSSSYAEALGVDLNKLIFSQPNSAEEALAIVEDFSKSPDIGLIVLDSVAALTPQAEIDGEVGQSHIGITARLLGQALRKITSNSSKAAIVFINQFRQNISTFANYGDGLITPGGNALKYFASIRIDMRRSAKLTKNNIPVGNKIKIKVVKNKFAAPFKTSNIDVLFGRGINKEGDLINICLEKEILKKEGNSIFYGELKLGGKMESSEKYLAENPEMYEKITEELKKTYLV